MVVPDRLTLASLTRVPIAFGSLEMNKFIHHATAHPVIAQHFLHLYISRFFFIDNGHK